MSKLLSELIRSFATKAGIDPESAELKAIITNEEIKKFVVPDTLATQFESGIHSLESAESALRSKLHAEALNGVDALLEQLAKAEAGMDDEGIKAFKSAGKTADRIKTLTAKVSELASQKAAASAPDKAKITEQINALNQKISDMTKANETALADLAAKHLDEITSIKQESSLSSHQYAMDVPMDVNITTAKQFLSRAMAKDGVKSVFDKTTGSMKLVKLDGTDYFDQKNVKVAYSDYEKAVLAENKLLKVADSTQSKSTPPGNTGSGNQGGQGNERNSSFLSEIDAQIALTK